MILDSTENDVVHGAACWSPGPIVDPSVVTTISSDVDVDDRPRNRSHYSYLHSEFVLPHGAPQPLEANIIAGSPRFPFDLNEQGVAPDERKFH